MVDANQTKHCVMIPFLNRHEQVAQCMNDLITQGNAETFFLLVDDGSTPEAIGSMPLQPFVNHEQVHLIHHKENLGVAAARNSGIDWCRRRNIEILIMIDSDCVPDSNIISEHLRLHQEHPEAVCIGGRIVGEGKGFWAELDGITSWIHSSSHFESDPNNHEFRPVKHPYHLATTNFSVKLKQLPDREFVFDERLISGEDCLLIREMRREKKTVYFSSTPRVFHEDRAKFSDVFKHHYEWGHHQYFIQLGGDISSRCFNPYYRALFVLAFFPLLPLFALLGAYLNSRALRQGRKSEFCKFFPWIVLLWLGKGIAVLEAAIWPHRCLLKPRYIMEYEVALLT